MRTRKWRGGTETCWRPQGRRAPPRGEAAPELHDDQRAAAPGVRPGRRPGAPRGRGGEGYGVSAPASLEALGSRRCRGLVVGSQPPARRMLRPGQRLHCRRVYADPPPAGPCAARGPQTLARSVQGVGEGRGGGGVNGRRPAARLGSTKSTGTVGATSQVPGTNNRRGDVRPEMEVAEVEQAAAGRGRSCAAGGGRTRGT